MKIHEYQAKALLHQYGVMVPAGEVARDAVQAGRIAAGFSGPVWVKAQIHAGGRGKSGGILYAADAGQAQKAAGRLIGSGLVTPQTGPEGKGVRQVLVEQGVAIRRELYLSVAVNRAAAAIELLAATAGGMDIEEVAATDPDALVRVEVDPLLGLQPCHARTVAFGLGLAGETVAQAMAVVRSVYRLFVDLDCSLVEINPLAVTSDGRLLALDAKVDFDDSGLFRHPELQKLRDPSEEDPLEVEAAGHGLNYVRLDGAVGTMVNGAGLAMATMDMITRAGFAPANFLDVGGGASEEMIAHGMGILLRDPNVRAVFVNIFGGILRCDLLARGVIRAARERGPEMAPVLVRLDGTNVDQGKELLAGSGLPFLFADTLADAAAMLACFDWKRKE